jgi:hypothetical protein
MTSLNVPRLPAPSHRLDLQISTAGSKSRIQPPLCGGSEWGCPGAPVSDLNTGRVIPLLNATKRVLPTKSSLSV